MSHDQQQQPGRSGQHGPWVIEVDDHPCSPNAVRRLHWAARRRHDKPIAEAVYWQAVCQQGVSICLPRCTHKASVVVVLSKSGQPYDTDNKVGVVKVMIDALVKANLIRDDSPEWLELAVLQKRGKKKHARIEVTWLAPVQAVEPEK